MAKPAGTQQRREGRRPTAIRTISVQPGSFVDDFQAAYLADPIDRIRIIKTGVPATTVEILAKRMEIPKEKLLGALGLGRAKINRKVRERKCLSADESSRVFGMARLIGQVEAMVNESGNPESFDAATWVARWLERPMPALGGQRPAEFMDTPDGQALVSNMVARMQSGAYA